MQSHEPLNEDWSRVDTAMVNEGRYNAAQLVPAMIFITNECATALRAELDAPLTPEEQLILDSEDEDNPQYYQIMYQADAARDSQHVLDAFNKCLAAASAFITDDGTDYETLATISIQCWDYIVPEYQYHQLAHMSALAIAQLVSPRTEFHDRTWLFQISDKDRLTLFLSLAQTLDLLKPDQVHAIAARLPLGQHSKDA